MANDTSNYPDFVFIAYDEDFSAQTHDVAVSLEAGSLVGVPVKYVRNDLNTRPAAPVDGLETVEHCAACGGTGQMGPYFPGGLSAICANCTNLDSQVNELRKEVFNLAKKIWHAEGNWQLWSSEDREIYAIRAVNSIIKSRLEADNAALTARVKELEEGREREADPESVFRFTDSVRDRLDWLDNEAGRQALKGGE